MLGFRPVTALVSALAVLVSVACSPSSTPRQPEAGVGREVTLFLIGDLRGTIEPCGCTTDPLGDLARTAQVIADARAAGRAVVVLDAGSMLYSAPTLTPEMEAQELLKADLLVDAYGDRLAVAAVGLGAHDLAKGAAAVRPARQAANVPADAGVPLEAPRLMDVGACRSGCSAWSRRRRSRRPGSRRAIRWRRRPRR
jgi:2',3'-cyclic-nucleotide 2'-phosphodiesterase (5'-nucleotidase family)